MALVMKLFSRLAAGCEPLFGRYLLATNTVSSGVLMGLGDVIIQKLEKVKSKEAAALQHDWVRTGRMFTIGLIGGPISHAWYWTLDKFLIGTSAKVIAKKILLDQTIASPTFLFIFFMGMGTMEQKPVKQSFSEFKENFWTVYKMDWTVWPAAQAINFYFLPTQYRVLYVALVTLGWDTYLSAVKHKPEETEEETLKSQHKNNTTDTVAMVANKVSIVAEKVSAS